MYKDYLFKIIAGDVEGEEILCKAVSQEDAINILVYNYGFFEGDLKYLGDYTVEEDEMMGIDTFLGIYFLLRQFVKNFTNLDPGTFSKFWEIYQLFTSARALGTEAPYSSP